jgi:hypothetical protein
LHGVGYRRRRRPRPGEMVLHPHRHHELRGLATTGR